MSQTKELFIKDGIQIDKGAVLTQDFILKNRKVIEQWLDLFLQYPDLYIDLITPSYSSFQLFFYQRELLRVFMRYTYVFATFTRAFSKSFLAILSRILTCIFLPNTKTFVCADIKATGIKIAKEKINQIFTLFPILEKQVLIKHEGTQYIEVIFRNGSMFDCIGTTQGTRGIRRTSGIFEEAALMDGDAVNERVLPTLNISRKDVLGHTYEDEPTQQQIYITTAGSKSCYAYEKLVEFAIIQAINPDRAFVIGGDYRLPVAVGLLNKSYIDDIKMSATFKEQSFAREYMSVWTGVSSQSWINTQRMERYRTIINYERQAKPNVSINGGFYLISIDVGRYEANSVICVHRVQPKENFFLKKLVYIEVMNNMRFAQQAIRIKQLNNLYRPREIVVDGTGIGAGLIDDLTDTNVDANTGIPYGPIGVMNDEKYSEKQDPSLEKILYVLKANNELNSQIHSIFFTQIMNGHCRFLAPETQIRRRLLSTKTGQKMSLVKRTKFLMPYEMTSRLFDQIANLKIKNKVKTIQVERISTRMLKDRFSAYEYGLYRIKYYEEEYFRGKNRKKKNLIAYLKFTSRR